MSNEELLRSVIREMVLREGPVAPSNRDIAEEIIDNLNIALGGLDLIAVAAMATGYGAPIGAVWLKGSGIVSGVINAGSMVLNLTEEPPDLEGAAIDLVECIVSILTIGLAGRAAGMGVSLGIDVAQAVVGIIEGTTGKLSEDEKSTVVAAVSKAKSGKATGKIVDVNKVIADLVSPDEPPISKDDLLDLISGDVPTSSLTPAQVEDVYQIYLQYHSDFQLDDAGSSRPTPKVSASPARSQRPARRVDSTPAAKSSTQYQFMYDGRLLYNGSQVVGNVTNMRKGDKIPESGLTLVSVKYNDQGTVSRVTAKSPNGALVDIPMIR
jgi:hypothetical protein